MNSESSPPPSEDRPDYHERTPDYYLQTLDPAIRSGLTDEQLEAIRGLLGKSIPRPAPKLVDLRFWLDFFSNRFYVVLYIGKDRRQRDRSQLTEPMARKGNAAIALLLLIGINLLVSIFVLVMAFSIKYLIGISLFPHVPAVSG